MKTNKIVLWKNLMRLNYYISSQIDLKNKKLHPLTAVTIDLGIWLNLKMVLYLENLCIMEKLRVFNPKPLVAPGRYRAF
jgi:hypothetical protein